MNPTQETCKRLTIYLGESLCKMTFDGWCSVHHVRVDGPHAVRDFTTPADRDAVYGKIYAEGKWKEFFLFAWGIWVKSHCRDYRLFTAWLFCLNTPDQIGERMEMVSAWLKENWK